MAISVWYDREGDYLEVSFKEGKGYFKDAGDELFLRVDEQGHVLGFAILNVSRWTHPKRVELPISVHAQEQEEEAEA